MLDLVKKAVLTGLGVAVLTKDKLQDLASDLAKTAQLSEQEGRDLVDDLMKQSEQAQKELTDKVNGLVTQALDKMNLATKAEVTALKARIERLEGQSGHD